METDFTNATITGCRTYGASAWNVTLVGTVQHNLIITKEGEPVVTVDDLEVAQFIHLILTNRKIRNVIHTMTSKSGPHPWEVQRKAETGARCTTRRFA